MQGREFTDLSTRAQVVLIRLFGRVPTATEVGLRTMNDYLREPAMGRKTIRDIHAWLASHGIGFAREAGCEEPVSFPALQSIFDNLYALGFRPSEKKE